MLESEIREQIITQTKNIKFLKETIRKIESLPEEEANKRIDEYIYCQDKLFNSNCLDDSITRRRILHEMNSNKEIIPEAPNLYKELISVAVQELKSKDYIYWIDNRYSCKDGISNKTIIQCLIDNYFRKQNKFGGYISKSDFKKWVCDVFMAMNFAFSDDSIKKQIDSLL
ncbi:MAG: hypothetical protein IKO57_07480 [Treponema sp.]|nr:hypothetical protein [Treponema sp.]